MIERLPARSTMSAAPTAFQRQLRPRIDAGIAWLRRSIVACDGKGSAGFYSRVFHPVHGWEDAYPETTGYLVPTLLRYAEVVGDPSARALALEQAEWVLGLQAPDGSLPGGFWRPGKPHEPSVFNTGQMVLGLVAAHDETDDERFLDAASRAASWLAAEVDDRAGTWVTHAYVPGYSPAYYTRVCWPMLEVAERADLAAVREAAVRVLDTIVAGQRPNGAVSNWGFRPGRPATTHGIAYTIRGLVESGRVLGDDGTRFAQAAARAAEPIRRRFDMRGRLAGDFDDDLRGNERYVCLTGNCQLAIVWLLLAATTHDPRYANSALGALTFAARTQRLRALDPGARGAIPGASPRWGAYLALRYPNWATKFFVDAALLADAHLDRMLAEGPCAWR